MSNKLLIEVENHICDSVSNKIHINNFGICIGEFKTEVLQVESNPVFCFYMNPIKEEINKTFQDGQLLQKTRDFFKGYLGLDIFQNFKLVFFVVAESVEL